MANIKKTNKGIISTKTIIIFWLVVIIIGFIFAGKELALGLMLAAIISIAIMQYTINTSWQGQIQDIKTKQIETSSADDEGYSYKNVTYAYIKLSNGKTKKIHAYPNWKIGDKIKKEKGTFSPKIIK